MSKVKHDLIVMHALPRNDEIPTSLDGDYRSSYFRQMKHAFYMRIALLEMLFSNV